LEKTGFDVSRRVRLVGKTGNTHEINLIATRATETIAIECKNCGEDKTVGIMELRNFQGKLTDLRGIRSGMYVTNTSFSSESNFATENKITLWDGDKLSKLFLSMNIGRFGSSPERRKEKRRVLLEMSLPLRVAYERATNMSIANPSSVTVKDVSLIVRPFYLFEYKVDFERTDRSGKNHRINNEGNHVVDAQNGKIISTTPMPDEKIYIPKLFSNHIDDIGLPIFFSISAKYLFIGLPAIPITRS
jgi:hypothetical protein